MPKVRKSSVQAVDFEVSPWQTKKRKYDDADQVQEKPVARIGSDEQPRVSLEKDPTESALQKQQAAQSAGCQQLRHLKLKHDGTPENTQPVAMSTEGNSRRRILGFLNDGSRVAPDIKAAIERILEQAQPSDSAAPTAEGQQTFDQQAPLLEGTACLVWLPDGQMTGELYTQDGDSTIRIYGKEVISERECTRDAEWKLLHVTLHRHSSQQGVDFFLEKTGCDAATLSAPFLLHGSEAGLLENATLQSDPSIHLSFACEELLSDKAAEKKLAMRHPELCKRGAIINTGAFICRGSGLALLDQPYKAQCELYDSDLDA